jgi:hypothetical protein
VLGEEGSTRGVVAVVAADFAAVNAGTGTPGDGAVAARGSPSLASAPSQLRAGALETPSDPVPPYFHSVNPLLLPAFKRTPRHTRSHSQRRRIDQHSAADISQSHTIQPLHRNSPGLLAAALSSAVIFGFLGPIVLCCTAQKEGNAENKGRPDLRPLSCCW